MLIKEPVTEKALTGIAGAWICFDLIVYLPGCNSGIIRITLRQLLGNTLGILQKYRGIKA